MAVRRTVNKRRLAERTVAPHFKQYVADSGNVVPHCEQVIVLLPSIPLSVFCLSDNQIVLRHYVAQ